MVPTAAGPTLGAAELKAQWTALGRDEKTAWRELAALWKVDPGSGEPCAARHTPAGALLQVRDHLATLKSLDRPGFLGLRDEAGRTTNVVLIGLRDDTATLLADGRAQKVSLAALASSGRASSARSGARRRATPARSPRAPPAAGRPVATQLAGLAGEPAPPPAQTFDAALRTKVVRFQTANGLSPVGKAGPTTFMQLNRATGVEEPRLAAAP
jgi:general secretion pathway protein A